MPLKICPETRVVDSNYVLFDAKVLNDPYPELFSCEALEERGFVTGWARGRGETCFFRWEDQEWVLRHCRRGGIIAPFLKDIYLGFNVNATRSWKEWRLLCTLYHHGLPVPRPVAARAVMNMGHYRADLITVRIPDSRSLSDCLQLDTLPQETWSSIGSCLRKFHDFGVYHADLNANNILLDGEKKIYLIDFDQCTIRSSNWWKNANLKRLHRSLNKFRERKDTFYYGAGDWDCLIRGYSLKSAEISSYKE